MSRNLIKGIKIKNRKGLDPSAIAEAIEQGFLAKGRPAQSWVQKKTFSPSSIGYGHGTCPRFWFLAFSGTKNWQDDVDAMGIANMSLGSVFHDEVQSAMEAGGMLVEAETQITIEDPPIMGYLDAVINWEEEEVVCEIKTTRQESFIFKETSRKPSANHLIQLLIYLKATGRKRGFLLYVNKNDQTFLVIPVELTEENEKIIEDVFEWLRTTRAAYDNNSLPVIPFRKTKDTGFPSNATCRACPVRKDCFDKRDEGDIAIPTMVVPKP